jgi:hypothetical protein
MRIFSSSFDKTEKTKKTLKTEGNRAANTVISKILKAKEEKST